MQLEAPLKKSRKLSLTPLIDVVFLLLIFFMLASTFSKFTALDFAIGGKSTGAEKISEYMLLRILSADELDLNGERLSLAEIRVKLEEQNKTKPPKLIIKPSKGATVQSLVKVIDLAKKAGINSTTIIK